MVSENALILVISAPRGTCEGHPICQNDPMDIPCKFLLSATLLLAACGQERSEVGKPAEARPVIGNTAIDEASGLQASRGRPDTWFVHNDDGAPVLFAMTTDGRDLGSVEIQGAGNRDWEDITGFRLEEQDYLVIADTGDNFAQWDEITLYFIAEPRPGADGRYRGNVPLRHRIDLRYPDGPRDCESVAFDPVSQSLLFLTKLDVPPRLYSIDLETALASTRAELEFLGESIRFRPPSPEDMRHFGPRDGRWVSQPTGMDIDADGLRAAVISYRSVYLFEREPGMSWAQALTRPPVEFLGPPARKEESIGFSRDGEFLLVTTEGVPAPLYRFPLKGDTP
jgi:hypothetical protein